MQEGHSQQKNEVDALIKQADGPHDALAGLVNLFVIGCSIAGHTLLSVCAHNGLHTHIASHDGTVNL